MAPDPPPNLPLEIGHVLFIDIVGYSKLLINEQSEVLQRLNELVRGTEQVHLAEATNQLIRLPSGDGMALVFRNSPEAPANCALEISAALASHPQIPVRMGIHSGPVNEIRDVNERANIAGAGINVAQRVMDCGDAGHILLSKRVADDLAQYRHWQPCLHDLGECEVKHGLVISIFNLYTAERGNPATPLRFQQESTRRAAAVASLPSGADKRRMLVAVAILLVAALAAVVFWFARGGSSLTPGELAKAASSIAVLPFRPLIPASGDQVLELGMADTLITKLSNSREMIVPSLNTVRPYGGMEQDSLGAGRKLGVSAVLEGTVQKAEGRLRVSVRLIKVADGSSLWAETFDEKFTDVFAVQDTIARKVAEALALRLSGDEQKLLTKRYTENVDAYQLYLTGRFHWNRLSPAELTKSISYFEQAIALDPNYALAYFGLADAYRALSISGDARPKDILPQAKAAARKAIEIDPSLAEPHVTLALIHVWFDWDWAAAESEARRALQLNPNLAFPHIALAQLMTAFERHPEAIAEAARARQLDPVSPIINALEGLTLLSAGRTDEATVSLEKALELNPNLWVAHLFRGRIELEKGNYAAAIAEFNQARVFSGGGSEANSSLAYAWARSGDPAKARALLAEWQASAEERYLPPYNVAVVYLSLDQSDECFVWLEKAFEDRDVRLFLLRADAKWDPVRADPRFGSILQRMGLK